MKKVLLISMIIVLLGTLGYAQEPSMAPAPTTVELDNLGLRALLARSEVQRLQAELNRDRLQKSVLENQLAILENRIPQLEQTLEQAKTLFQEAVDTLNAAQAQSPEAQEAIEAAGTPEVAPEVVPEKPDVPGAAK